MFKKILLWALTIIILLILLPVILGLFSKDISVVDETGLQLQTISIPDEINSYFNLEGGSRSLSLSDSDSKILNQIIKGDNTDKKVRGDILLRNVTALEQFSEASKKPKFQDPISSIPENMKYDMILPGLSKWRTLSRLSAVKAIDLAESGNGKAGIDEAVKSVRVGYRIENSQSNLIEYLVGMAIKEIGLQTIAKILPEANLNAAEKSDLIAELNSYYDNGNGLVNAFKIDHITRKDALDLIAGNDPKIMSDLNDGDNSYVKYGVRSSYYFKLNKTKQLSADYTKEQIENVTKGCNEIDSIKTPEKLAPITPLLYFTENAIGKILQDVVSTGLQSLFKKKCESNELLAQVIEALK